jgi:opacity protein-like surface antigen
MTKKLMALAFGGVAMLMAGPALADGYKRAPVAAACCDTNWNGIYFGGGFGWAALLTNQDDHWASTGNSNRQELGSDGAFGFLRIGLDRQIHSGFVLGAFADYEFHDIGIGGSSSNSSRRQKKSYHYNPITTNFDLVENDASLDSTWAVGARLGLVRSCCTMWYVNGGYTQAELDRTFRVSNNTIVGNSNSDVTVGGWFAGAGVEQQLGKGFSLFMEYRYASFETKDVFNGTYTLGGVNDTHRHEVDPIIHSVRFGLSYKFDVHQRAAVVPLK